MLDTTDRLEFTDSWVRDVAPPERGRKTYYDTVAPSLCLIVTHMGGKSFYRAGRPSRVFIGHPSQGWTVKTARLKCSIVVADIAVGKDPVALRRKAKKKRTFGYVFRWYIKNYAKKEKKTWQVDEKRWDWVKDWDQRDINDIGRHDFIQRLNHLIDTNGPNRARHEMSLINSVFNQAKKNRWVRRRPGRGVPLPKPNERDRHITKVEMPRFFKHLKGESLDFQDYVTISLFTGARQMNVLSMEWSEISKDQWTIPAVKAKEGKAIPIPVLPAVHEILKRRKATAAAGCQWVFPSNGTKQSKRGHITTVQRRWDRFCETAKLVNLKPHDLRHTIATWMVDLGISKEIIAKALGHEDEASTDIYAKVNIDPVRIAMDAGVKAIQNASVEKKSKKSRK